MQKTILESELRVHRSLPANLSQGDYYLFEHEIERVLNEFAVELTSNVYLTSHGQKHSWFLRKPIASNINLLTIIKGMIRAWITPCANGLIEDGLVVTDSFSGNYFHWLSDVMVKIQYLIQKKSFNLTKVPILVPTFADKSFSRELLSFFPEITIIYLQGNRLYKVRQLHYLTEIAIPGNYRPDTIRSFRDTLFERVGIRNPVRNKKLWISREKAIYRQIENEKLLEIILERYGWQIVCMEDFSVKEQVKLVSESVAIGGLHGAGLSNILFLDKICKVLEIRFADDAHNNCYFSLSNAVFSEYWYIVANPTNNTTSSHSGSVYLDPDKLEKVLQAMGAD